KPRDVVLGHEVPHIRRQKQRLIDIPGAKVLAHSPSLNQTRWHLNSDYSDRLLAVRFSNRPFGVKRFQTIHYHSVDVARGLVLLFGIGTTALPAWNSKTRWNNLKSGLAIRL